MKKSLTLIFFIIFLCFKNCSGNIGDECSSSSDCGENQICDLSMHGGYCTITPCELNKCPENSVCVFFENNNSYCMKICNSDSDCRDKYFCIKDKGFYPFCGQK